MSLWEIMLYLAAKKIATKKVAYMKNPFKFGTVVEAEFFTDRIKELQQVKQTLNSDNHLTLISPRRFGKTSLIYKAINQVNRPCIMVNLQSVTATKELASLLLKRIFKLFPFEKLKHLMHHFRFVPTFSINPMTDGVDVSFQPGLDDNIVLEDVFGLVEKLGEKEKLIIVLDEFQEIRNIDSSLDKQLRAVMQIQKRVNYVFLGSQESMMEEIFEKKKSPFYHFGMLMRLGKIPYSDFFHYVSERLCPLCTPSVSESITRNILEFSGCHPYYTQQLAYQVWNLLESGSSTENITEKAVESLLILHDFDYERLWMTIHKTDKRVLVILAKKEISPLESSSGMAVSTAFSALKRLSKQGYVIKNERYEIDDPFFRQWILHQIQ